MTELTEAVERAVRPVWASRGRKRRMRRELLAHLRAAFEEERGRLGDDRLALNQALARFGDPAELTRDLQASVPRLERVLYARLPGSDRFGHRTKAALFGTGKAPRRDAVLFAGVAATGVLAAFVLLPLVEVAGGKDWSAVWVPWQVMAAMTGHAFVSGLLFVGYIRAVGRPRASLARAAIWGAAAVLWGAAFVPVMAAVKPDDPLWSGLLRSPDRTATAAVGAWGFLIALAVVSRYVDARRAADDALPAAE